MPSEAQPPEHTDHPPADQRGADERDFILAALDELRGGVSGDRETSGSPPLGRQKASLLQWADRMGLLLDPRDLPEKTIRGGQEHDLYHDESKDRYLKVTRNGVFGLSPGIELALVSSSQESRRFHLWEASPIEYLERLHLQNLLVPGINRLEGVIYQANEELALVTSQPRFNIIPVSIAEIDVWFAERGFEKITDSAYYRSEDNLGIFDAHDKNLVRAGEDLIPFDVIPCHPAGGFLEFIHETIAAGHSLRAERRVSTTPSITD